MDLFPDHFNIILIWYGCQKILCLCWCFNNTELKVFFFINCTVRLLHNTCLIHWITNSLVYFEKYKMICFRDYWNGTEDFCIFPCIGVEFFNTEVTFNTIHLVFVLALLLCVFQRLNTVITLLYLQDNTW